MGCTGCSPIGQKYDPAASSTSHGVPCDCGSDLSGDSDCPYLCTSCVRRTCADSVVYTTGNLHQVSDYQIFTDAVQCGATVTRTAVGALYNMTGRPTLPAAPLRDHGAPLPRRHRRGVGHTSRTTALAARTSGSSGGSGSGGQQDGVIGLGFPAISTSRAPNLVLSLASTGVLSVPQFSMTLNQTGGALALGGVGDFMSTAPGDWLGWTPVVKQGFWQMPVQQVQPARAAMCV